MKYSYFIAILQLTFIIIFIALTLLVFFPLQRQLSGHIQNLKYTILQVFEENLNGSITFSSIHPSIFNFIEIRDLKIENETGEPILILDRIILYYNIGDIFRGDIFKAPRLAEARGGVLFPDNLSAGTTGEDNPEEIFSFSSDNLELRIQNFELRSYTDDISVESMISRGTFVVRGQYVEFDLINNSMITASSAISDTGLFELRGNTHIEGSLTLPDVLTISQIIEEGVLKLHVISSNLNSNVFDIDSFDFYLQHEQNTLTLEIFRDIFAAELVYDTAGYLRGRDISEDSPLSPPRPLMITFVSSEWKPSELIRLEEEYQQYEYVLDSIVTADIILELDSSFQPLYSEMDIKTETVLSDIGARINTHIQFDYSEQILDVKKFHIGSMEGDNLNFQGGGNVQSRMLDFSGNVISKSIPSLPEFETQFTVAIDDRNADMRLFDSTILGISLGETEIRSAFDPDSIDVDIRGGLISGEGEILASAQVLTSGSLLVPEKIDIELYLNDLPLREVSDMILTVLTPESRAPRELQEPQERSLADLFSGEIGSIIPDAADGTASVADGTASGLFDEMAHSRITAAVSSQIVLRDTIDTIITVQDFQVRSPASDLPQLRLNAVYDNGIFSLPRLDITYGGQDIQVSGSGDFRNSTRFQLELDTMINSFPYSAAIYIFPNRNEIFVDGSYQSNVELRQAGNIVDLHFSLGYFPLPALGSDAWFSGAGEINIDTNNIAASVIDIPRLSFEKIQFLESTGDSSLFMKISGSLEEDIQISSVTYNDAISLLSGSGTISINEEKDAVVLETAMRNDLESYAAQAEFSMPEGLVSSTISIENFTTRRLGIADITGLLNTEIVYTRSDEGEQLLNFNLQTVNARLQDEALNVELEGVLQNEILYFENSRFELSTVGARNITATYDLPENTLSAETDLFLTNLGGSKRLTHEVDINILLPGFVNSISDSPPRLLSDYWDEADGSVIFTVIDEEGSPAEIWKLYLQEFNDNLTINGGPTYAPEHIRGVMYSDGSFELELSDPLPITFTAEGFLEKGMIDATLLQLKIAPETLVIDLDIIALRNGNMEGSMRIQGNIVDPNFYGTIFLEDIRGNLALIPQPMRASSAVMILEEQSIQLPPFLVEAGEGRAIIQGGLVLDHWIPSELKLSIDTEEGNVPIVYDFNSVAVDGWVSGMLELDIDFLTGGADIAGSIVAHATGVTISDIARIKQAAAQAQN
ncbi:MAG: hypothetical protein ACR2PY_01660, partial [Salinispira sp.]